MDLCSTSDLGYLLSYYESVGYAVRNKDKIALRGDQSYLRFSLQQLLGGGGISKIQDSGKISVIAKHLNKETFIST